MESVDFAQARKHGANASKLLQAVVRRLEQAGTVARWDLFMGVSPLDLLKFYHLWQARRLRGRAQTALNRYRNALAPLGLDHQASPGSHDHSPLLLLADVADFLLADLWVFNKIDRLRIKANIALSRMRTSIKRLEALEALEAQAA